VAVLHVNDQWPGTTPIVKNDEGKANAFADHLEPVYLTGEDPDID